MSALLCQPYQPPYDSLELARLFGLGETVYALYRLAEGFLKDISQRRQHYGIAVRQDRPTNVVPC